MYEGNGICIGSSGRRLNTCANPGIGVRRAPLRGDNWVYGRIDWYSLNRRHRFH